VVEPAVRSIAALTVAATLVVGCGPGGREDDIRSVTQGFETAIEARDGERACALLGTDTRSKLEQEEKSPCPEAIVSLELPPAGAISDTEVFLTSAVARTSAGGSTFLDESSLGWRVSAAGCRPGPPDEPYECVLEG